MIIAHCAKALSTVHALFRDFDINVDAKISKVSYHFLYSIVSHNNQYNVKIIQLPLMLFI